MKNLATFALFCSVVVSAECVADTNHSLIGIQQFEPRIIDTTIAFVRTKAIRDSEKTVLNNLGINYIWEATNGTQEWPSMMSASEQVMDWADANGGFPKVCIREYHVDSTGWPIGSTSKAEPRFRSWWGMDTVTYLTKWHLPGDTLHVGINVDMPSWMINRPDDFSLGNAADTEFHRIVDTLVHKYKGDYGSRSGFHSLYFWFETHEWKWNDPAFVAVSLIESTASRWRRGLGYAAQVMKDSGLSAKAFYLEEAPFVIGFGGNSLYNTARQLHDLDTTVNADSVALGAVERFAGGVDGLPDTLYRMAQYFKEMAAVDLHGDQWYPINKAVDSNTVSVQREYAANSHSWQASAQGIAKAKSDQRTALRGTTTHGDTLSHPIPATDLFVLLQAVEDYDTVHARYPTRTEMKLLANLALSCGVKLPVWYHYDAWFTGLDSLVDTSSESVGEEISIRHRQVTPPWLTTRHRLNTRMYDNVKWVNDSVLRPMLPIMDTLEYYNGLTTRFGCRYGDERPFGGGDTVHTTGHPIISGWGIRGHEFLDSVIAQNSSHVCDSISRTRDTLITLMNPCKYSVNTGTVTQIDSNSFLRRQVCDSGLDTIYYRPVELAHGTFVDIGFFHPKLHDRNDMDTTKDLMYVLNRRTEPSGERYITCVLRDSARPLWKKFPYLLVHDVVAKHDTCIRWRHDTASFTYYYGRADGKLFSFMPIMAYDAAIISNGGVSFNNSPHAVRRNDSSLRIVYMRNDSIFARKIVGDSIYHEKLVARGGYDTIRCGVDTLPHYMFNRNPVIATRRHHDEDLIVWDRVDTNHSGLGTGYAQYILGSVLDWGDNIISGGINPSDSCYLSGAYRAFNPDQCHVTNSLSFLATPCVCADSAGWIVGWADSAHGTQVVATNGHERNYQVSAPQLLSASGIKPARFPSVAYGTDTVASGGGHLIVAHIVWQQPDNSLFSHIWHRVIEAQFPPAAAPRIMLPMTERIEQVSIRNNWICRNTMPCVAVDAQGSMTAVNPNVAHIVWHADIMNDSLSLGRTCYIERLTSGLTQSIPQVSWNPFGVFAVFASGVRNYVEPFVYVSPAETGNQTLILNWFSDLNSLTNTPSNTMNAYVPGEGWLRWYPMTGEHPTLSYSSSLDSLPYTLYQTPDSPYHALVASRTVLDAADMSLSTWHTPLHRDVFSITVDGRAGRHPSCWTCCQTFGVSVGLIGVTASTAASSSSALIQLKPIPYNTVLPQNGTVENTLVQSQMLHMPGSGQLKFDRFMVAKDSMNLNDLTAGGATVKGLIELVDSINGSRRITLDSIVITSAADSVYRTGTLTYNIDTLFANRTVYVKASTIADTVNAQWHLMAEKQFETSDSVGTAAPLAKDAHGSTEEHSAGRLGMVPNEINPIALELYPNPVVGAPYQGTVSYNIPMEDADDIVDVHVWDMHVNEVSHLFHGFQSTGKHKIELAGSQLPSGRYVVAVHTRNHQQSTLLIMLH